MVPSLIFPLHGPHSCSCKKAPWARIQAGIEARVDILYQLFSLLLDRLHPHWSDLALWHCPELWRTCRHHLGLGKILWISFLHPLPAEIMTKQKREKGKKGKGRFGIMCLVGMVLFFFVFCFVFLLTLFSVVFSFSFFLSSLLCIGLCLDHVDVRGRIHGRNLFLLPHKYVSLLFLIACGLQVFAVVIGIHLAGIDRKSVE